MIPFVSIELDKVYNLRFGMGAQVEFEQLTGISCIHILDNQNITMLAQVLWAMLRRQDKDLTFDRVLELVDDYAESEEYVINKVTEAIYAAFPEVEEDTKNK